MRFAIYSKNIAFSSKFLQTLKTQLSNIGAASSLIMSFSLPSNLLSEHQKQPFDIVFIEACITQHDILDLGEQLRSITPHIVILCIGMSSQMTFSSLPYLPQYYIRKEFIETDLDLILPSLISIYGYHHKIETFKSRNSDGELVTISVKLDSIRYLSSDGHRITFHSNRDYCHTHNLNDYEKRYQLYGFVRSHSRFLVNSHYIQCLEDDWILLSDQTKIPLSRHRISIVKAFFSQYGGTQ